MAQSSAISAEAKLNKPAAIVGMTLGAALVFSSGGCKGGSPGHASSATPAPMSRVAANENERYDAAAQLGYRLEWSAFAVIPSTREVEFVYAWDDIVAVHGSGNSLTILEAATGQQRWNIRLGANLAKFVGILRLPDGRLIDVAETELYALDDQTGVLQERQRLSVLANTAPVRYGGIMVVGGASGEVLGHNLRTGHKQWGYQLQSPIESDPILIDRTIAVVSDGGSLMVLEPLSGSSIGTSSMYDGLSSNPAEGGRSPTMAGLLIGGCGPSTD
jgi:outer membrane protein assembly factor BamB